MTNENTRTMRRIGSFDYPSRRFGYMLVGLSFLILGTMTTSTSTIVEAATTTTQSLSKEAVGGERKNTWRGLTNKNKIGTTDRENDDNGDDEGPSSRIINGQMVTQDRYPYFALQNGKAMCGAVLIGPRFVLSAAHCLGAAESFFVGARTDPSGQDGAITVSYQEVIVHPRYQDSFDYDITLYYLDREVTGVPYLRLERNKIDAEGQPMTVIGFGDTAGNGSGSLSLSDHLREVEVRYIPPDTCQRLHFKDDITDDMLCASEQDKDACYGDSGGPLLTKGSTMADDRLVGLVSWGRGCADSLYPGVYTRISYFYDWIVEMACLTDMHGAPEYMDCETVLGIRTEAEKKCSDRGNQCTKDSECCSNRCWLDECTPSSTEEKGRLTNGHGGAAGGAIRRRGPFQNDFAMYVP
mmetsp:Transcript_11081/g.19912  ORF Transcript_11081/g.19912 Transcript_11081/m.19912 type:complete len:410 (-) Transcript_11081:258-1487(-)